MLVQRLGPSYLSDQRERGLVWQAKRAPDADVTLQPGEPISRCAPIPVLKENISRIREEFACISIDYLY